MSKPAKTIKNVEIENLTSILFSTLDEKVFFAHLGKFLDRSKKEGIISKIYLIAADQTAQLVCCDGEMIANGEMIAKGQGVIGHVVRTKSSYFSNNVERDPIFGETERINHAELCVPVKHEGVVIATIHYQSMTSQIEFSKDDISDILEILNQIHSPIANIKMYLAAKFLNETLMKRIEEKEKELLEKEQGLNLQSTYKIKDKEIVGRSEAMKNLCHLIDKISDSKVNALISGESGTGKQLVARKVHCRGGRKNQAFVAIDCSSVDAQKLEEEIFGSEKNVAGKVIISNGLLEVAHGGTLFINNIDRLPVSLQSKLASFMNDQIAFRVGGKMPYRADVRILAATTKNLAEEVTEGHFREDLYYSLNTINMVVPPLRDRLEDIEILANHFLNQNKGAQDQKSMSPGIIKKLKEYSWPGNVRELQSVMERAYILAETSVVDCGHLADSINSANVEVEQSEDSIEVDFSELTLDELERRHICKTLEFLGGNKTKTAKTLGITVKTLYNKLHSYGMINTKEA